jgi:hypothetical protein
MPNESRMITVSNDGQLITSTNYWSTVYAREGKVFCSINAGAIRILLPPSRWNDLSDMSRSQYCILSRGPWPQEKQAEGIEIMFEDFSDSAYALHLTPKSFNLLPANPERGREWTLAVYVEKDGKPHKSLERVCHWRRVPFIPFMKPWEE